MSQAAAPALDAPHHQSEGADFVNFCLPSALLVSVTLQLGSNFFTYYSSLCRAG
jgi:hypothetical protein